MLRRKQVNVAVILHLGDARFGYTTDISISSPISLVQFQDNVLKYATTAPVKIYNYSQFIIDFLLKSFIQ
jgi:hypothetical protein